MKDPKKTTQYLETNPGLRSRMRTNWRNRMGSIEKKMSRGASNIFRIIKNRCKWGEKSFPKNTRKPQK